MGAAAPLTHGRVVPQGDINYGYEIPANRRRKFLRALAVAMFHILFITVSLWNLRKLSRLILEQDSWGFERDYPEFASGEVVDCISRQDWSFRKKSSSGLASILAAEPPYQSDTTFYLSSEADLLYFFSRGILVSGNVRFSTETTGDSDAVSVDLHASYWSESALDYVSVCELKSQSDDGTVKHGVGIFSPRRWHPRIRRDVIFDIKVGLPAKSYSALAANYPNFKVDLLDLQGQAPIETLTIQTSNREISVESVETKFGLFKSSNAHIEGKFNASHVLNIETSNAPIDAEIYLYGNSTEHPTVANVKTTNSRINGVLSLNQAYDATASSFNTQFITSNGPNTINVTDHPVGAPLQLNVMSSNAAAKATLHPAFEGLFTLRTSNAAARVINSSNVEDPSGEGRKRSIHIDHKDKGQIFGKIFWGEWSNKNKWGLHISSRNGLVEADFSGGAN